MYAIDENGKIIMVDQKKNTDKLSRDGEQVVNINGNGEYHFLGKKEAKRLEKQIIRSAKPRIKKANLSEGKKTRFKLSKDCNINNIAKITYNTNNENVKVTKMGRIIAKSSGKTTVTATIIFKNGAIENIQMKIKVKQ